jgi:hypothetical protein
LDFSNSLLDSNGWIFPIFYFLSSTEWENLHRKPFLFSHERWGFLLKIFPPIHSSYGGAIPAWPAALAAAKAWRCCSAGRAMPKPGGDARGMGIYWGYLHEKSRLWEHVHLFDGKLQEEHGTRIYMILHPLNSMFQVVYRYKCYKRDNLWDLWLSGSSTTYQLGCLWPFQLQSERVRKLWGPALLSGW